jgi:imidazolonepropionase-like amidohydrolase
MTHTQTIRRSVRMGMTAGLLTLGATLPSSTSISAQTPIAGQTPISARMPAPGVTVIQNATILTVSHGTIDKGSILIRNGKIAEVGRNVSVPSGATVIDAAGKYVMPGIIDCHSHIGVDGGVNEGSVSVSSMVGIEDVLDPEDMDIYRALAGGVTSSNVLHGSANAIGGKNQVIKLRWGKDAQSLKFEGAMPGIKFALGENPKRSNRAGGASADARYPGTRMGVMDTIREAFVEAKAYQRRWADYRAKAAKGDKTALAPGRDLRLEPLVEVLEGKRLVHAHSYRSDEILQLLRVAEEMGFKIATLQHVLEGYRVADEIAKHGAGASTFSDWWAYKVEAYEATPYNAALMTERGVVVSINSDSAEEDRHLNQEAAKMMKYGGMSETEALKLVTLNPAKQLRIDNRVGSIDVGKDADLVIYTNHPLSVYSVAEQVLIDGTVYFDRQKDIAGRAALEQERKALTEKTKGAAPRRPGRPPTSPETTPGATGTPGTPGGNDEVRR